jgi:NTP pyrophosphatase (non-canonical NTP hydrolase)
MDQLKKIAETLEKFAVNRDWNQFHSPKNLAMALSVEVAELVEEFQWLTEEQSKKSPQMPSFSRKEEIYE